MKQVFKRITVFLLSICIFALSVLAYPVSVYASDHGGGGAINHDRSEWIMEDSNTINVEDDGKVMYWIEYIISQCGAIISDHSITKAMANDQTMKSYIAKGYYDANEDTVTFPQETVTYVYNIIQQKAKEYNPFTIQQTFRYTDIPASTFNCKADYDLFRSYASSHNLTYFLYRRNSCMYLGDLTPYFKDGGGFVFLNNYRTYFHLVNSNWNKFALPCKYYTMVKNEDNVLSFVEQEDRDQTSWSLRGYSKDYSDYWNSTSDNSGFLLTKDGGRIRIFHSLTEFMDYNAGQRKVYFGSGFYDFNPADITATWDEISDAIDRMDGILQDILDAITDNPGMSEEDLEKLIDKLIGKIGEIGDKTDETNSILGDIASSLSGYFSSVLSKLDEILAAIKAIVWIEANDKLEGDKSDLFDLVDKIWKNPQEGSQEAADTLTSSFSEIATGITKKFPFSIPWDIHALFTIFTGTAPPQEATYRTVTLGVTPFTVDPEDLEQDEHEAPYFKLPLRVDSFRIYEEVVIDLKDFKSISTLSRGLLSALFGVFLIKFTIRIIELFKGGAGD